MPYMSMLMAAGMASPAAFNPNPYPSPSPSPNPNPSPDPNPNPNPNQVGLMFVRATDATTALARRVENRTWGGWEQGVFNEELSWGLHAGREVGCCHPPRGYGCDLARHFVKDEMAHGAD